MSAPEVTVVVPSHRRALRLRWLLNALEEQTLPRERWELVVVHDYDDADVRDVIERHPLFAAGVLRHLRIEPGTGSPSRQRNIGWRAARAPLVAFTDDDCRADPSWLEQLLGVAHAHPGAIVQGRTRPDPLEIAVMAAPHHRSLWVEPPGPFAQTCNILYPRPVLEAHNGFDERFPGAAGEDLDLAIRARRDGAPYEAAPDAMIFHAVESYGLVRMVRLNFKWRDVAYLVKQHPQLRRGWALCVFWRATHFRLALALAGLALGRRIPGLSLLALPYLLCALNARGPRKGAWAASAAELPGRVVIDLAEIGTMVVGSVKHRTLVL